jgi:hypothetical protein
MAETELTGGTEWTRQTPQTILSGEGQRVCLPVPALPRRDQLQPEEMLHETCHRGPADFV